MNSNAWRELLIKCKYEPKILPVILSIVRVAICFLPQIGSLHPDEFRQSSDIVAGNYFNSKIHRAWEFQTDKPIRCMLIPNLLNTIAFKIITLGSVNPELSAYWLLVAPRLVYTIFSFSIDYSFYKLCHYYSSRGLWYLPISVIFQTSFICLGCLTRTISNLPEVVLFSILLVLVCQNIKPRFRVLFVTPARTRPAMERVKATSQYFSSIMVGFVVALGTFNRPTFPAFAIVPLMYWIMESFKRNSHDIRLVIKRALIPLTMSAIFTSIIISLYDTAYYKNLKTVRTILGHLMNLELDKFWADIQSKWVLTPYNFIRYNTDTQNLSNYGLHMPYTHMLINVPIYFSLLGLLFYGKLIGLMLGSGIYRLIFSSHRIYSMMLMTTVTSIILLSFIPHQEFRFLIPIIVPLTYTFAFDIYASNKLFSAWFIINLVLVYFYTFIHQSGVTSAALDLNHILKSHALRMEQSPNLSRVNIFAFRCYDVPSYVWNIPKEDGRFNLDIGDTFEEFNSTLVKKLYRLPEENLESQLFYAMLPSLYEHTYMELLKQSFEVVSWRTIRKYYPHFTGEDLGLSLQNIRENKFRYDQQSFSFSLIETRLEDKLST